jgi:protoporphyrinogen oxidase
MNDPGRVLILGAGPTGLGAAYRLQELGFDDYLVIEAASTPGGLASSFVDEAGFTWDVGGHVQFSHYKYYDRLLDRALGDAWLCHERESWVWMHGRFIPYPLQNNIHRFDGEVCARVLAGMEKAAGRAPRGASFREWLLHTFGQELCDLFLFPYNLKVWGYPLDTIDTGWMGERVAVPDLDRIRRNVRKHRDDVSWGPNSTFRFPERGGTGAIWQGVAGLLPADRLALGNRATAVDLAERAVTLADGRTLRYDTLVTTIPLKAFAAMATGLDADAHRACDVLVSSACHVLGIGLRGPEPAALGRKCWVYFPEANSPYYRVTVFSHYSPHNVPEGEGYWSLMAEVCETPCRPAHPTVLGDWTVRAFREDGLIDPGTEVVSVWHRREMFGYPTPALGRDEALSVVLPALARQRVFSRGRFGAWKYEVSNQDHSCMQGVELADALLGEGEEVTIHRPDHVNAGAFKNVCPQDDGEASAPSGTTAVGRGFSLAGRDDAGRG